MFLVEENKKTSCGTVRQRRAVQRN